MTGASNTLLALILVALGIVGLILSFLVPDRKKSFLSLILAGVVVFVGLIQVVSQSVSDYRWRRRLTDLREQRQVDLDKLREDFKKRAAENAPAAPKK
jgi:hypothetical protein